MELLLVGDKLVAEGWFVTFEECRTSEDAEVGETGLALEAVLVGCGWITILVNNVLGRTDVDDVDCISMGVMEEGAAKLSIVEKNVGGVVDFAPFGFADTVHFLMFRSGGFDFDSK